MICAGGGVKLEENVSVSVHTLGLISDHSCKHLSITQPSTDDGGIGAGGVCKEASLQHRLTNNPYLIITQST